MRIPWLVRLENSHIAAGDCIDTHTGPRYLQEAPMRRMLGMRPKIIAVCTLVLLGNGLLYPAQAAKRPNILLLLTDDMKAAEDFYSVMPSTMKIFRRKGTTFPNGIATTPTCCPSRASIFSGQYSHNHGVTSNKLGSVLDQSHTVQYELQRAGYHTAIVGKFLNDWVAPPSYFDSWAIPVDRDGYPYYDATFDVNGRRRVIHRYTTDFARRKGIDFLERFEKEDDSPWFLLLSPNAPHRPATAEPDYATAEVPTWTMNPATSERNISDKPPWLKPGNKSKNRSFRRKQLRTLMSVDDMIEKLR